MNFHMSIHTYPLIVSHTHTHNEHEVGLWDVSNFVYIFTPASHDAHDMLVTTMAFTDEGSHSTLIYVHVFN